MSAPGPKIFLLAASASGQGKTSVTAALARKLQQQGQRVRVFKTGADFIDPMLLQHASGQVVHSLDTWMLGLPLCRHYLSRAAQEADVILIEGVMGLYDGTPSAFDLAQAFGVPVLLVLDAAAMAQTAGALVQGLRDYGPIEVAGVIANKVGSSGHAKMIADSLRQVPLLGYLPRQAQALPERHLGLVLPDEVGSLEEILQNLADQLQFDQAAWQQLPAMSSAQLNSLHADQQPRLPQSLAGKTIAIARDAAFAFIYPANLACLQEMGAELVFFSPLANQAVPATADALYLPGGYPELHAATLQAATLWQASLRAAHGAGMPIWAECGGMMAICDGLIDAQGQSFQMAGLQPGVVRMQQRITGLGPQAWATSQGQLRGHTFHFSRFDSSLAASSHTQTHPAAQDGEAIYRLGTLQASYFHAFFPSCPAAAAALFSK